MMNENQAWKTGLLIGTMMKSGIKVLPLLDANRNYSSEVRIRIDLPGPDGTDEEVNITIKVLDA